MNATIDYVAAAEARVDDALDALARLAMGDPTTPRAEQEYADAQQALRRCRERWLGSRWDYVSE